MENRTLEALPEIIPAIPKKLLNFYMLKRKLTHFHCIYTKAYRLGIKRRERTEKNISDPLYLVLRAISPEVGASQPSLLLKPLLG